MSELVFEKSYCSGHLTPQNVALARLARVHYSASDVGLVGRGVPEQERLARVKNVAVLGRPDSCIAGSVMRKVEHAAWVKIDLTRQ